MNKHFESKFKAIFSRDNKLRNAKPTIIEVDAQGIAQMATPKPAITTNHGGLLVMDEYDPPTRESLANCLPDNQPPIDYTEPCLLFGSLAEAARHKGDEVTHCVTFRNDEMTLLIVYALHRKVQLLHEKKELLAIREDRKAPTDFTQMITDIDTEVQLLDRLAVKLERRSKPR